MGKGFNIVQRKQWNARSPRGRDYRPAGSVTELYLHWPAAPGSLRHLNTRREIYAQVREYQRYHMDSHGWNDIGYNYLMAPNGLIIAGRTFRVIPAAQEGHNTHGVAICVMLGMDDNIPHAVKENLRDFTRWCQKYAGHKLHVRAHRDVNQTSCPGSKLTAFARQLDRI